MRRVEPPRTAHTPSGVAFDPKTGEILDLLRDPRVVVLPLDRRAVARRRWHRRLMALAPFLVMLAALAVLVAFLVLTHSTSPPCEPNLNC